MKFIDYIREQGYRRYRGAVAVSVYEYFDCPNPGKAVWHHKPGSYQCTGCREQCETDSPEGFQSMMELKP